MTCCWNLHRGDRWNCSKVSQCVATCASRWCSWALHLYSSGLNQLSLCPSCAKWRETFPPLATMVLQLPAFFEKTFLRLLRCSLMITLPFMSIMKTWVQNRVHQSTRNFHPVNQTSRFKSKQKGNVQRPALPLCYQSLDNLRISLRMPPPFFRRSWRTPAAVKQPETSMQCNEQKAPEADRCW